MLNQYDTKKMYRTYNEWPKIAMETYEFDHACFDCSDISHVVFAGMGGSGALSDIFSAILSKSNVHVSIVKGYLLPKTTDKNSLVIATSVSGNTAETLTVLESAKKIGSKLIAFSDGGKMEKYCNENNIQHRHIPMYHSPRASFVAFLYSMLKVLEHTIPVKYEDVKESIKEMEKQSMTISSENLTQSNRSLEIAEWLRYSPIIYYPWGLQAAAIRFKNSLQENSKIHASAEDVIEACHNGIVSWERQINFSPILLEGQDDYIKTKERWTILKNYFESKQIDYKEVLSTNGSILTKLINLIYLLDFSTIYLAVKSKIDPSPVLSIDYIKNRL